MTNDEALEAPSAKHQAPEKHQAPNRLLLKMHLELENWSFSGAWCLALGASFVTRSRFIGVRPSTFVIYHSAAAGRKKSAAGRGIRARARRQ